MDDEKAIISDAVEAAFGKRGKQLFDFGLFLVDTAQRKEQVKKSKWKVLSNKNYDKNYQFNKIIINNLVPRNLYYYGTKGKKYVSMYKIKQEIENYNYIQRNIIITGAAGMGKTTVLKWLFYKSNVSNCNMVFLYAKMFLECTSLDEFLTDIMNRIPKNKRCIVFFDGLDELPFITGTNYELQQIIRLFDQKSNYDQKENVCRFIITTRTEHFEFHKMFVEKKFEYTPDNYIIYELKILTKRETFKICKSIKKLSDYERKTNVNEFGHHFMDKWPSKEMENITVTEKEYLKLLKEYINVTMIDNSVLNSPLFCRYAYQYICDLKLQNKNHDQHYKNTSERIYSILKSFIKWEFHDHNNLQTEGGIGKEAYQQYENEVFDFLTQVAGLMEKNDFIDRKQWESLLNDKKLFTKSKKGDKGFSNAALCVLQENTSGGLEFIHNIFKDYFLALYFSQINIDKKSKDYDNYHYNIKTNSEFVIIYIEQLIKSPNELINKVINELLEINDNNLEEISEYASGNIRLDYTSELSFTIEDYLSVFPCGIVLYAGMIFNKNIMDNLYTDGILEVKDAYLLNGCNQNVISKNNYLKGIQLSISKINRVNYLFGIYNGYFIILDGELETIYEELFENYNEIKRISIEKELNILFTISETVFDFLDEDKNYWFLFDVSLYTSNFYQMIPENEKNITALFERNCLKDPCRYIHSYGIYLTYTLKEAEFISKAGVQELNNIQFVFDSNITSIKHQEYIVLYYALHRMIVREIECRLNKKILHFEMSKDIVYELSRIGFSSNEKINVFISDINLLALYILNESVDMYEKIIKLAKETLIICEKYQHSKGIKFREFLLQGDISYDNNYLKKVFEFAKNYIWI